LSIVFEYVTMLFFFRVMRHGLPVGFGELLQLVQIPMLASVMGMVLYTADQLLARMMPDLLALAIEIGTGGVFSW
jgi:hypothetical protein